MLKKNTLEYLCYLCLSHGNDYEKRAWSHPYSPTDLRESTEMVVPARGRVWSKVGTSLWLSTNLAQQRHILSFYPQTLKCEIAHALPRSQKIQRVKFIFDQLSFWNGDFPSLSAPPLQRLRKEHNCRILRKSEMEILMNLGWNCYLSKEGLSEMLVLMDPPFAWSIRQMPAGVVDLSIQVFSNTFAAKIRRYFNSKPWKSRILS